MRTRHLKVNNIFTVELVSNPSTGYIWKYKTNDGITLTNQQHRSWDERTVGSPVDVTMFFRADIPGEYILELVKVRPWEKNTPPLEIYQERIFIE